MKKAWVIENTVREVATEDELKIFVPAIAALFTVSVPSWVVAGAQLINDKWLNPVAVTQEEESTPDAAPPPIRLTPVEFKLLFTAEERIAIKAARETNPAIDDFFDIIDDPRLTHVNLSLQSTINGVMYLASENLIAVSRVNEILAGQIQ